MNVYSLNWDQNSSDVEVIYPAESIGNQYFAVCFDPNVDNAGQGRNGEFLIDAAKDNTTVKITPSKVTDNQSLRIRLLPLLLTKQSFTRYNLKTQMVQSVREASPAVMWDPINLLLFIQTP